LRAEEISPRREGIPHSTEEVSLLRFTGYFLKLGAVGFGGPIALLGHGAGAAGDLRRTDSADRSHEPGYSFLLEDSRTNHHQGSRTGGPSPSSFMKLDAEKEFLDHLRAAVVSGLVR
jgi:hypothetical protein